tara:strand:+ start:498 stop:941 length:444 start_codon:yes stop_codon:yes gene_type:complete
MKNIKNIFRCIEAEITKSNWYNDDWEIYNRGDYLQLYKTNWCNENQGGVHFETYIESAQIKDKTIPILMHAEEDCPHQQDFIQSFLDAEGERIRGWRGYQTVGSGYSICKRKIPLNAKNIEQRIVEELNRLRSLEATVDEVLSKLNG